MSDFSPSTDVFGLRGKPVLVVGGGSGIGRATSLLFARVGAEVAITDVDSARAENVRDEVAALGVKAVAVSGDVTTAEGAAAVVDAAYGAAKAGAMALARSMANEWAPYGIRINCVAPDIIATPRVVAGFQDRGISDMDAVAAGDGVPLARWGRPEEIAGPLVFLVSDLASFITGQTLVADGGTQARFPHGGPKPFDENDNSTTER